MAGRPKIPIGAIGAVDYKMVDGLWQGRARTRDAGGTVRRLTSRRHPTKEEVRNDLVRQARDLAYAAEDISKKTTLTVLLDAWIKDRQGGVKYQTLRMYRDTVRWLTPFAGGLAVKELTPARIKKLLDEIEKQRSKSAVHHARVALSGAFNIAVEQGAVKHHPLRSVRKRKRPKSAKTTLTLRQLKVIRQAIRDREPRVQRYTREPAEMLRWATEVQLGSALRISEVLALRNMDVDFTGGLIDVNGTLIDDENWQVVRQDGLKGEGQERQIELPLFALTALSEARSHYQTVQSRLPVSPAIRGESGNWVAPRNIRRSLRSLAKEPVVVKVLAETGLEPTDLHPHIFRRTAGTLIAVAKGDVKAAQELFGHAHESTTLQNYMGSAFKKVGSARMLDELLDGDIAS